MSESWGDDFDEEGDVIGEVPEDEPSFFRKHNGKILGLAGLLLLFNASNGGFASPAALAGVAVGSLAVSYGLVYIGVGIRNR